MVATKTLVLGVSGSIAAYRAADLAREFMRAGFSVRVCLTDSAQKFVLPALFEGLTGNPCLVDTFEEPITGRMAHIDWARQCDAVVIAPATANTINKIAAGVGDDMLTTIALATDRPLFIAPAMNPNMYSHEATQAAIQTLVDRGVEFIQPVEGDVACGENGQGKLASIGEIVTFVGDYLDTPALLSGKHLLITSGPTQEPIDDVRYLTNRSSGKMGSALAAAALQMGATVTVVAGPQKAPLPKGAHIIRVQTAEEMLAATKSVLNPDWVIGAAAVADYRPANRIKGKMRRESAQIALDLIANPDVLAEIVKLHPNALAVAFAAEPDDSLEKATEKMKRKGVLGIAVNDVSNTAIGFDSDQNELTLLLQDGTRRQSGRQSKTACAKWLLTEIAELDKTRG